MEGASDLDVAAVCESPPSHGALARVAAELDHSVLPCPARLLELVVYSRASLDRRPVEFELNLNTGAGMATESSTDPASGAGHCSRSTSPGPARARPSAASRPSRRSRCSTGEVMAALAASLDWHEAEAPPPRQVLAACGAWRFAATGELGSKREAADWASVRSAEPEAIRAALAARDGAADAVTPGAAGRVIAEARTVLRGPREARTRRASASGRTGRPRAARAGTRTAWPRARRRDHVVEPVAAAARPAS